MPGLITGKDCHNLIDLWLEMMQSMEAPLTFGRWSFATAVAAWLERRTYIQFGPMRVNPNMYVMLVGSSGSRKSTAIKLAAKLIRDAGYTGTAAQKTSKEKFLLDLEGAPEEEEGVTAEDIADSILSSGKFVKEDSCCFVPADEFNEFTGNGNIEFFSLLGTLWDYEGVFQQRVKNSKSVEINNPCVSILGGNTHTNIALLFPQEAQGQGFLSRLLFIQAKKTDRRITLPPPIEDEDTNVIMMGLDNIKLRCTGELKFQHEAFVIIDRIYQEWEGLDDMRFLSYSERRLTHLLKLIITCVACRVAIEEAESYVYEITPADVLYANSMLTSAEYSMPEALGEYGKSKNWDVQQKVLNFIEAHVDRYNRPPAALEIFEHVSTDITNPKELPEILHLLTKSHKIKQTESMYQGKQVSGFIKLNRPRNRKDEGKFDLDLLWEIRHEKM